MFLEKCGCEFSCLVLFCCYFSVGLFLKLMLGDFVGGVVWQVVYELVVVWDFVVCYLCVGLGFDVLWSGFYVGVQYDQGVGVFVVVFVGY